jgi:DNA-directed RNA polymerase subunit RPC12/RpoP
MNKRICIKCKNPFNRYFENPCPHCGYSIFQIYDNPTPKQMGKIRKHNTIIQRDWGFRTLKHASIYTDPLEDQKRYLLQTLASGSEGESYGRECRIITYPEIIGSGVYQGIIHLEYSNLVVQADDYEQIHQFPVSNAYIKRFAPFICVNCGLRLDTSPAICPQCRRPFQIKPEWFEVY